MDEPEQLTMLELGPQANPPRMVEYIPPSAEAIDQYVHSVCMRLTDKKSADYCDTETVRGLTNFLQVVANILVKYRNKGVRNVQ